jgi:NADH-quinone oxidoreductase subunit L
MGSTFYTNEFSFILIFLAMLIHVYSFFYFKKDPDFSRFTLLIGFFLFFMLLLINTGSWVFLFVSWEGVGFLSFMLVSFWYSKINTFKSGIKVLLYNRLGDFFFFLSIGLIEHFTKADSVINSDYVFHILGAFSVHTNGKLFLDVVVGAGLALVLLSKSAQFGFHIWLLEAMEAPLPASSLIHSATLVCAGVVLFFKSFGFLMYVSHLGSFIVFWASLTAAFLSFSALLNYDIKKILAYSTGSHVSLMLVLSVSGGGSLGYAYTLMHASVKVFIFLLFGFIIDVNQGVRDIRKMGGFFRFQHVTYYGFFSIAALSSLPFFPLAFLKDLAGTHLFTGNFIGDASLILLMLATVFNYVYMFRLFFKIFFGDLLSTNSTYFNHFYIFYNSIGVSFKKGTSRVLNSPLFILFLFCFFFEVLIFVALSFDYGFSENRILNIEIFLPQNAVYKYLAVSNSMFFFFIFLKSYSKIFK